MAGAKEAYVLAPGEGRSIDLGAFGMTVKATSDETGGAFSLLEAEEPPGFWASTAHGGQWPWTREHGSGSRRKPASYRLRSDGLLRRV